MTHQISHYSTNNNSSDKLDDIGGGIDSNSSAGTSAGAGNDNNTSGAHSNSNSNSTAVTADTNTNTDAASATSINGGRDTPGTGGSNIINRVTTAGSFIS